MRPLSVVLISFTLAFQGCALPGLSLVGWAVATHQGRASVYDAADPVLLGTGITKEAGVVIRVSVFEEKAWRKLTFKIKNASPNLFLLREITLLSTGGQKVGPFSGGEVAEWQRYLPYWGGYKLAQSEAMLRTMAEKGKGHEPYVRPWDAMEGTELFQKGEVQVEEACFYISTKDSYHRIHVAIKPQGGRG